MWFDDKDMFEVTSIRSRIRSTADDNDGDTGKLSMCGVYMGNIRYHVGRRFGIGRFVVS